MPTRERREAQANRSAELMPVTSPEGLPAIKTAGVMVFAYVKNGVMRVSVDLDDAGEYWRGDTVPLRICVQGETVFAEGDTRNPGRNRIETDPLAGGPAYYDPDPDADPYRR